MQRMEVGNAFLLCFGISSAVSALMQPGARERGVVQLVQTICILQEYQFFSCL